MRKAVGAEFGAWRSPLTSPTAARLAVAIGGSVFLFVAVWRERSAEFVARRAWGELSPVLEGWAQWSWSLTSAVLDRPDPILSVGGAVLGLLAIASLFFGWRRGLAGWLWLLGVLSVAIAQRSLLRDHALPGIIGYAGALFAAFLFGWLIQRRQTSYPEQARNQDYVAALWVLIVALFLRLWALGELPGRFEGEMGVSMLASSSWYSLVNYLADAVTTSSIGCAHLFVQWASFAALGDSVYALRASAVAMGVATVWNLFWFVRQHVGLQGALCAAVLAICGAEQLWWSRSENTYFIAVCLASVITVRLTAWLLAQPSWHRAFVVALWMGATRLFYLAAVTLAAIPILGLLHGIVFMPANRQKLLKVCLVLLLGVALWASSLSWVHLLSKGEWQWIHPAVHGELTGSDSTPVLQRLKAIGERMVVNTLQVVWECTVQGSFSQWYQRHTWPYTPTMINVGIVGVSVLGVGIALGQCRSLAPAILLLWLAVASLPALLSIEPADRRMAGAFPAVYALAGYGWQQVVNWLRQGGSKFLTALWCLPGWVVLLVIASSSASSHLRLPKAEVGLATLGRATKEIFRTSEALYYEMDEAAWPLLVMVHSSVWRQRLPCAERLMPGRWLATLLEQPCSFQDVVWRLMVPPAVGEQRRAQYTPPSRWSVFVADFPDVGRKRQLLRQLFPQARERRVGTPDWNFSLTLFSVSRSDVEALQQPERREEPLRPQTLGEANRPLCLAKLRGAVLTPDDGWYLWRVDEPFHVAAWKIGDASGSEEIKVALPLASGFQPFELETHGPCGKHPAVLMKEEGGSWRSVPVWNWGLADDELTRAAGVVAYEGYFSQGRFGEEWGEIVDMGLADSEGGVALVFQNGGYEFWEFDLTGKRLQSHPLDLPGSVVVNGFVPGPQGYRFVHTESGMFVTDRDGRVLYRWPEGGVAPIRPQVVWWNEGQTLLAAIPGAAEIRQFDLAGRVLGATRAFQGGPRRLFEPTALAYDSSQKIFAVAESDGRVLLLRMQGLNPLDLVFVGELRPPMSVRRLAVRVLTFDRHGRLLVGDPESPRLFVYDVGGRRLMAQERENDWPAQLEGVGVVRRVVPWDGELLVLAGGPGAVRFVERGSAGGTESGVHGQP